MLPLTAGRYSVSLQVGGEIFDTHAVADALTLEVVERDLWGHGRLPPSTYPPIWWPTTFRRDDGASIGGADPAAR